MRICDLIIPFISTNSHYYYDDVVTNVSPLEGDSESRNVNFNGGVAYPNDVVSGINWKDLRPSLKLPILMQAIEEKYTISFVSDFFNTDAFNKLYIWLNNDKGLYGEDRTIITPLTDFTLGGGDNELLPLIAITNTIRDLRLGANDVYYKIYLTVAVDDVNDEYNLIVRDKTTSKEIFNNTSKGTNTLGFTVRAGGVFNSRI